jgi:hypothetical protein
MRSTQLRLCEVTEVVPEEGLWLADLWTDQRLWIRERRATRQLVRWDLMAVRLMPGADGELVIDGPPYPFPASDKEEILDGLGPRFVLYYNVSEDTYGMSEPAHATASRGGPRPWPSGRCSAAGCRSFSAMSTGTGSSC